MAGKLNRGWLVLALALAGAVARSDDGAGEDGRAALDAFLKVADLRPDERVLGLVGFHGSPLPETWLVLTGVPDSTGPLREFAFAAGRVVSEREVAPLPGQDLPHLPLERETLRVGAEEAFGIVAARARVREVRFARVHFQLRVRDEGEEPVWMLKLFDESQISLGIVYLSARGGEVLRETWGSGGTVPTTDRAKISAR